MNSMNLSSKNSIDNNAQSYEIEYLPNHFCTATSLPWYRGFEQIPEM